MPCKERERSVPARQFDTCSGQASSEALQKQRKSTLGPCLIN